MPECQVIRGTSWRFCLVSVEEYVQMKGVEQGAITIDVRSQTTKQAVSFFVCNRLLEIGGKFLTFLVPLEKRGPN